jgi:hypothetical protein
MKKEYDLATFVSHVLPAAKRHQPGITNNEVETVSTITEIMVAQDVLVQNTEASPSSVIQDVVMQDTNAPLSGLPNQDIIMQDPDAPYPELYSMPGPSSDINMHQSAIPVLPLNQPFTSGFYAVWGKEKVTIRRCMICVQAGRDGKTCKGKNNQRNCEFIEVCALNSLAHCSLIDIDRHKCGKYDKCKASNLENFIVVGLAVNKIVICE